MKHYKKWSTNPSAHQESPSRRRRIRGKFCQARKISA